MIEPSTYTLTIQDTGSSTTVSFVDRQDSCTLEISKGKYMLAYQNEEAALVLGVLTKFVKNFSPDYINSLYRLNNARRA